MSTTDVEELGYFEIMPRVAEIYEHLMECPDPKVVDAVGEMMDLVDAFHREGLGRLVEMIRAWRGEIFLDAVSQDEVTGEFLAAYDLGEPVDDRDMQAAAEAVDTALEEIRPFVESDGGMITVESIKDGVVTVRLLGSCDGCPSSSATLTGGLEEALRRHWPNFRRLEVASDEPEATAVEPEPAPVLLQIGKKKPDEG